MQGWRRYQRGETSVLTPGAGSRQRDDADPRPAADPHLLQPERDDRRQHPDHDGVGRLSARLLRQDPRHVRSHHGELGYAGPDEPRRVPRQLRDRTLLRRPERDGPARRSTTSPGAARRGPSSPWRTASTSPAAGGEDFRELTGQELLNQIFYNTATYSGTTRRTSRQILNINNGLSRSDESIDIGLSTQQAGPFGLRFTYTHTKEATSVDEDVAEIVRAVRPGGLLRPAISTYDAGMTFGLGFLTLGADYRGDNSNQAIVRTDATMRRAGGRRRLHRNREVHRVIGTVRWAWESNTTTGINSTGKFRQVGGDIDLMPTDWLTLRFSATPTGPERTFRSSTRSTSPSPTTRTSRTARRSRGG